MELDLEQMLDAKKKARGWQDIVPLRRELPFTITDGYVGHYGPLTVLLTHRFTHGADQAYGIACLIDGIPVGEERYLWVVEPPLGTSSMRPYAIGDERIKKAYLDVERRVKSISPPITDAQDKHEAYERAINILGS